LLLGTLVVYNFQKKIGKSFKNANEKLISIDIFLIGSQENNVLTIKATCRISHALLWEFRDNIR
jgi:hypothetical protein